MTWWPDAKFLPAWNYPPSKVCLLNGLAEDDAVPESESLGSVLQDSFICQFLQSNFAVPGTVPCPELAGGSARQERVYPGEL